MVRGEAILAIDALARRDGTFPSGVRTELSLAREHVAARAGHLGLPIGYADKALWEAEQTCTKLVPLCESPIELKLLPWLLVEDYGPFFTTFPVRGFNFRTDAVAPAGDLVLAPQFAFVRYRADFALMAKHKGRTKIVIVECDGEQFHGAVVDNKRDDCFHTFGITTVRATGSETTVRPRNVTARVSSVIQEWASEQ